MAYPTSAHPFGVPGAIGTNRSAGYRERQAVGDLLAEVAAIEADLIAAIGAYANLAARLADVPAPYDDITIHEGSVDLPASVEAYGAGATPDSYVAGDLVVAFRPSDETARLIPAATGGSSWTRKNKTANYTALITDDIIFCDASGGTFTITLAASASMTKPLTIVNVGATGTVTADGNASETINGSATAAIGPGQALSFDAYSGNIRVF